MVRFIFSIAIFCFSFSSAQAVPKEGVQLRQFIAGMVSAGEIQDPAEKAATVRKLFSDNWHLMGKLAAPKDAKRILKDGGLSDFVSLNFNDPRLAVFHQYSRSMMSVGKNDIASFLNKVPDVVFTQTASAMNEMIDQTPISQVSAMNTVVDKLKTIKMPGFQNEDIDFLSKAFPRYFDRMSPTIKRRMIKGWLALPPRAPWNEQFKAIVQNGGPVIQKLFQLIGRESSSKELGDLSADLLSRVRPVPFSDVKAQIEREYGKPLSELYGEFSETPKGAGSVGQVHFATTLEGKNVAVKVLRPGVRKEMTDELEVFVDEMRGNQMASKLAQRARESFLAELDLRKEGASVVRAAAYNDSKMGLAVPNVIEQIPPKETVLTLERALGEDFEAAKKIDPRIRAWALKNIMSKWFDVNIETGFFHGDLHAGNIKIAERKARKGELPFLATYMDFGAVGELTPQQRKSFFTLFAATVKRSKEDVLNALGMMAEVPESRRNQLASSVDDLLKQPISSYQKMNQILGVAIENGLDIDRNMVMFSRTGFFLTRELERVNQEILKLSPGARVEKSELVLARAALKSAGSSTWKVLSTQKNESVLLDRELFARYLSAAVGRAKSEVSNACERLFGKISGPFRSKLQN